MLLRASFRPLCAIGTLRPSEYYVTSATATPSDPTAVWARWRLLSPQSSSPPSRVRRRRIHRILRPVHFSGVSQSRPKSWFFFGGGGGRWHAVLSNQTCANVNTAAVGRENHDEMRQLSSVAMTYKWVLTDSRVGLGCCAYCARVSAIRKRERDDGGWGWDVLTRDTRFCSKNEKKNQKKIWNEFRRSNVLFSSGNVEWHSTRRNAYAAVWLDWWTVKQRSRGRERARRRPLLKHNRFHYSLPAGRPSVMRFFFCLLALRHKITQTCVCCCCCCFYS